MHDPKRILKNPSVLFYLLILAAIAVGFGLKGVQERKAAMDQQNAKNDKAASQNWNPLSPEEKRVILQKGTERAFTGKYWNHIQKGWYACRQCGALLYESNDKFKSDCGWPSFDEELSDAVKRRPDADGFRTEIVCANCGGHLGHVFLGEHLTPKDTRHCVNSISLEFIPREKLQTAIFAGGCFWGVAHQFNKQPGVRFAGVGYIGGVVDNPTYKQVCSGLTGHREAVQILFDPKKTSYETLAKRFFEVHDPTQDDGQGPDIGIQYQSAVFYTSDEQKKTIQKLLKELRDLGYDPVTELIPAKGHTFWPAEKYHQNYYEKTGKEPYCHVYTPRFKKEEKKEVEEKPAP